MRTAITDIAHPNAASSSKRRLRRLYEEILETHPTITIPQAQLVDAVRDVALPHRNDPLAMAYAHAYAEQYYVQASATKAIDTLLQDRDDVLRFWLWGRQFVHAHFNALLVGVLVSDDPDVRRFLPPITIDAFLNTACSHIQTVLGLGIEMIRGVRPSVGIDPPPTLKLH